MMFRVYSAGILLKIIGSHYTAADLEQKIGYKSRNILLLCYQVIQGFLTLFFQSKCISFKQYIKQLS